MQAFPTIVTVPGMAAKKVLHTLWDSYAASVPTKQFRQRLGLRPVCQSLKGMPARNLLLFMTVPFRLRRDMPHHAISRV